MFLFVICFNFGLAVCGLLLAMRIYYLYRRLQRITGRLGQIDQCAQGILAPAPTQLQRLSRLSRRNRQRYELLVKRWYLLQGTLQFYRWLR